jgi:hypothetical protein
MKKLIPIILITAIIIFACSTKDNTSADKKNSDEITSKDSLTIELTGIDNKTVFDILNENHQIDYQSSSMGVFVKAIDSIYNSSEIFWLFSVNDSMAKTSSDKFMTKNGDIIKWHFRKTGN